MLVIVTIFIPNFNSSEVLLWDFFTQSFPLGVNKLFFPLKLQKHFESAVPVILSYNYETVQDRIYYRTYV